MKRIVFYLIACLISVIIFFTIGEIFFRIFKGPLPSLSEIIQGTSEYLHEPNTTKFIKSDLEGEFSYTAHINKYGYRGKDFDAKTKDKLRIFAVGDSFTFGVGAQDYETIPALIEKKLLAQGINVEVINAGIGHTSPITHYINIKNVHLQYEPDVILLLFDMTDLRDDWQRERNVVYKKNGEIDYFNPNIVYGKRDWWLTAVSLSQFCRWIHDKVVRTFIKLRLLGFKEYRRVKREGKHAKGAIATSPRVKSLNIIAEHDNMLIMRGQRKQVIDKLWKITTKYLTKTNNLLKQRNIPFIIAMYPYGIYVGEDEWSQGRDVWGFEKGKIYKDLYPFELMEAYTKSENIPFINAYPYFPKEGKGEKKYFFDFDGHLTPAGNEVVAQAIVGNRQFREILNELKE